MSFKKYLEWLPEKFQQAREEGKLDLKKTEFKNSWTKRIRPQSKKNVHFNKVPFSDKVLFSDKRFFQLYRIVVSHSNFMASHAYDNNHNDILMEYAKMGLDISLEEVSYWYKQPECCDRFISLSISKDQIGFADSYQYGEITLNFLKEKLMTIHKPALDKILSQGSDIGLKFYKKTITI